jgi:opacity protein-like surface antigen
MRRRTSRLAALAVLTAVVLASAAAAALAPAVIALRGTTSQSYTAEFSYNVKARTINGFRVLYTCRGKPATTDSDIYSIVDGGNDDKALARVKNGSVTFDLRGLVSGFSEDRPVPKGSGRLVVKAALTATGTRRALKGTARVASARCPSAALTFRAAAQR